MKKRQGCLEYNSAYTLIEVMLVLAIVSVVLNCGTTAFT